MDRSIGIQSYYVWNPINQDEPTWVRIGIYKFLKHIEIHQQRNEQNVVYDITRTKLGLLTHIRFM